MKKEVIEFKAIITSNPLQNTKQERLFLDIIGKEVSIKSYGENCFVVKNGNKTFSFQSSLAFYKSLEFNIGFNPHHIGEEVLYRTDGSYGIGRISWYSLTIKNIEVYDIVKKIYVNVSTESITPLVEVASLEELVNLESVDGRYRVVEVSPKEKCIRYYDEGECQYKRLIWYADGGFMRFLFSLISLGFNIDYNPAPIKEVNNFDILFQLEREYDLNIVQRGEDIKLWLVQNNKDVVKVEYPLVKYLLQVFNTHVTI